MKRIIWGSIFISEIALVGSLLSLPNKFYNQASDFAQYAGYARSFSPVIVAMTLLSFGVDLKQAKNKKNTIKLYCPKNRISQLNETPIHRFLDFNENQINRAIKELEILQLDGINCEDYVVDEILGVSKNEI